MKGLAVVAERPWSVSVREVDVPEMGPDDVRIQVACSWISNGTEGSFIRGERIAGDTPRAESDPLPFPHVPGYQKVGVVEAVGANVREFREGETVFATVSGVEGMFYAFGGHVSPAVTHRSQVWRLPEGLPPEWFSGLVLTQVGYNCGMRPLLAHGDAAVVVGDGLVGHWSAQTLQQRGARVCLLGRHPDRLAKLHLGPGDLVLNGREEGWREKIEAWAPGGVQVVVDTVGSIPTLYALLDLLRHDGHIASAGFYGPEGLIDIQRLRAREITLHAPAGWSKERMDATLDWVATGRLVTLPLVTHRFPVHKAADAWDLILHKRAPVLGVLLEW